jgi:hypothetical protein
MLIARIDKAQKNAEWGMSKKSLARSAGVPYSSAKPHFREDQGLKNRWQDFKRQAQCAR